MHPELRRRVPTLPSLVHWSPTQARQCALLLGQPPLSGGHLAKSVFRPRAVQYCIAGFDCIALGAPPDPAPGLRLRSSCSSRPTWSAAGCSRPNEASCPKLYVCRAFFYLFRSRTFRFMLTSARCPLPSQSSVSDLTRAHAGPVVGSATSYESLEGSSAPRCCDGQAAYGRKVKRPGQASLRLRDKLWRNRGAPCFPPGCLLS